jgi:hypothetical protein
MHLVGECDIAATKCAEVIQSVAKWIFEKEIPPTDLPSSSTVVNMMDRAQVLAKHQVAEEILASDRWDLHSDGTSRDTNKFMGSAAVWPRETDGMASGPMRHLIGHGP